MIDVLVRLEYKRQALRRRILRMMTGDGACYLVIGAIVFIIALVVTPLGPAALPPLSILAGSLIVVGGLILFTIVFIPVGLFLL